MKIDYEVDVLIVGFGAAGANAAIAAHDAGARVQIIEKQNIGGGNSAVCAGVMAIPRNVEEGVEYYRNLSFGTVSEKMIRAFAEAMVGIPDLLTRLGVKFKVAHMRGSYPSLLRGYLHRLYINPTGEKGFEALEDQVKKRNIKVLSNTSAKRLIQRPDSKEVIGLVAEIEGNEITIMARKAVVLTCGGYGANSEMVSHFNFPGLSDYIFPWGSPGNKGDGVQLATEAGASLWHMASIEWGKFCARAPSLEYGTAIGYGLGRSLSVGSYMFVNRSGKRFMAEDTKVTHRKAPLKILEFDQLNAEYGNLPAFMIFDQTYFKKGSIAVNRPGTVRKRGGVIGYPIVHEIYDWSSDNQAEVDAGWIYKANTIAELANMIGADADALKDTINRFNLCCDEQRDCEFERNAASQEPFGTPPFYGLELGISLINTQGGAKRNVDCQVVDHNDVAIPRLYSAGEFGSFFGFLYQGGSNYPEAWVTGEIAGRIAASETSWRS